MPCGVSTLWTASTPGAAAKRHVAARLDGDLHVVLGEVFGGQFSQAFIVFDEQYACIHPVILTAPRLLFNPVAVDRPERAIFKISGRRSDWPS